MYYCEIDGRGVITAAHTHEAKEGLTPLDLAAEFSAGNVYVGVDRCVNGVFTPASREEREAHIKRKREESETAAVPEEPRLDPAEFMRVLVELYE